MIQIQVKLYHFLVTSSQTPTHSINKLLDIKEAIGYPGTKTYQETSQAGLRPSRETVPAQGQGSWPTVLEEIKQGTRILDQLICHLSTCVQNKSFWTCKNSSLKNFLNSEDKFQQRKVKPSGGLGDAHPAQLAGLGAGRGEKGVVHTLLCGLWQVTVSGFPTRAVNWRAQTKEAGIMVNETLALTKHKDEVKLVHIYWFCHLCELMV